MTTRLTFEFRPGPPCFPVEHEHVSVDQFRLLCELYPSFKVPGKEVWKVSLPDGDVLLTSIYETLREMGPVPYFKTVPWYRSAGDKRLFRVQRVNEFEPAEYDASPFLKLEGEIEMGEHKHLHHDFPLLVRIKAKIPPIGYAEGAKGLICTQTCKEAMEQQAFVGLTFTPVVVEGKRQPPEPLWEIWSDRMMPPMCSALVDDDGNPVTPGDYSNGCRPAESEFPFYRYEAAALASMAGVDAAVTREDFGPKGKLSEMRRLMVSQRFRQWALKNKLKLDYTPVMVNVASGG